MCMKQLAETELMGAFDQKGQCIYANSPMASLLGYKLSMLRSKDITQLLPQPHGMLHLSYFRVRVWLALPAAGRPSQCHKHVPPVMSVVFFQGKQCVPYTTRVTTSHWDPWLRSRLAASMLPGVPCQPVQLGSVWS